ncbi:hypothetical protein FKP32DRAFT_433791 [Trametes sanguinea]|nr:hypothetical protein FKP32DRAFT_433791 [Trametes sanguinea]
MTRAKDGSERTCQPEQPVGICQLNSNSKCRRERSHHPRAHAMGSHGMRIIPDHAQSFAVALAGIMSLVIFRKDSTPRASGPLMRLHPCMNNQQKIYSNPSYLETRGRVSGIHIPSTLQRCS